MDRFETQIGGLRCLTYVPQGNGPHPILCFLHGAGEAATADREGTKPQPLSKVLANGSPAWHAEHDADFVSSFLVVCPQLERRRRWAGNDLEFLKQDAEGVAALVEAAIRDHGGDRSRLVLTGFSYGGEGAFQIAGQSGLPWSTIWAVDPALQRVPQQLPGDDVRVWVHYGKVQPGAEKMAEFAVALALGPWDPSSPARRVATSLNFDHPCTCCMAYQQSHVYQWLLAEEARAPDPAPQETPGSLQSFPPSA